MSSFRTTIEKHVRGCDCEVEIIVEYTAVPFSRGYREPGGCQIEPDEPAHIEIESVKEAETGIEIELTTKEEDAIERRIAEELDDADDFARSEQADRDRATREDDEFNRNREWQRDFHARPQDEQDPWTRPER